MRNEGKWITEGYSLLDFGDRLSLYQAFFMTHEPEQFQISNELSTN